MKPHKHAELIKAWADGAEIEYFDDGLGKWRDCTSHAIWDEDDTYRIKPQPKISEKEYYREIAEKALAIPEINEALDRLIDAFSEKEPQYLYVYEDIGGINITSDKNYATKDMEYLGKIKLEQDE